MSMYGLVFEFETPESLLAAVSKAYQSGYRNMDAYTPFPIEDLAGELGFQKDRVALISLIGGAIGGVGGFFMQWYANVVHYPINVGGRPYNSWPAFIPVTFEMTVLGASLSAALGMMLMNKLPALWHPVFNHPDFSRASRDRFFLCIQTSDPNFDGDSLTSLLKPFKPLSIQEVSNED